MYISSIKCRPVQFDFSQTNMHKRISDGLNLVVLRPYSSFLLLHVNSQSDEDIERKKTRQDACFKIRFGYLLPNSLPRHQLRFDSDEEPYKRPPLRAPPVIINTVAAVLPAVSQQHGRRVHFERSINLPGKTKKITFTQALLIMSADTNVVASHLRLRINGAEGNLD